MLQLEQLASQALAMDGTSIAVEFAGLEIDRGSLNRLANAIADLVERSGAGPAAAVAFVGRNRPSALAAMLVLISRSRPIRMVYPFQSAVSLAQTIARLDPAVVIADAQDFSEALVRELQSGGIAAIALDGMSANFVPGLDTAHTPGDPKAVPRQIEILTSGTTGPPKHVAVSYDYISEHIVGRRLSDPSDIAQSGAPALLFFPIGNISGVYGTLPPLLSGQRMALLERFSVAEWLDYVRRHRPARGAVPPAAIQMILDADVPREDLASMQSMNTGSAALDPATHRAFEQRYGVPILLSYGATEFGGKVTDMPLDLHRQWGEAKFGSVGRAAPGVELRVIDPVTHAPVDAGEEGILEVLCHRIGPDWIRTADLVVLDADGFLFHRGRLDGAIMRGGFKILPETIERAALLHPAVAAAVAVGIPDRRLGQVPALALQVKQGMAAPSFAELEAHLRDHILATHIPVAWRFVDDLPRTASLKIDRPAVSRLFDQELAA